MDVADKVQKHFSQYRFRKYPKGQILIHSGDEPEHIYYLVSGKVRQYDVSYRGDEIPGGVQSYPAHGEQRGTPSEMDWYYFAGLTMAVRVSAIGKIFRSTNKIHGSYSLRCPRRLD